MKALLVTSRVHFVPGNYDAVIGAMAHCEAIGGLLIIDNLKSSLLKTAAAITLLGATRIGIELFKNMFAFSYSRWQRTYAARGKPVWIVGAINSAQSEKIIAGGEFDLIVNARTRVIFEPRVLKLPPLGCINIHHGLLPEQRGVLCDLWALSEGKPAGFSIHFMTETIDAGPIISRIQVSDGSDRDFLAYLKKSAELERRELESILWKFTQHESIGTIPNEAQVKPIFCKNPGAKEIREMKRKGMRI